jgi:uncharacterized protein YdeI (YjbR/CyaY-like superfamily)
VVITFALHRTQPMPRSVARTTTVKRAAKSAAKSTEKRVGKSTAKSTAKSAAKSTTKPASKPAPKPEPKRPFAELEQVYAKDRAAWRRWLAKHHSRSPGIWLVFDKKGSRVDRLAYADAVEEALCFGWIDSLVKSLDDTRYMQLFTPRKPKSTWSRVNKERVARLIEQDLMAPAGLKSIEIARANGMWGSLDSVEALEVPDDLAAALAKNPDAARNFAAFAASMRKAYLHWVSRAVRPATRAERIAAVVMHSAANRKTRQLPTDSTSS